MNNKNIEKEFLTKIKKHEGIIHKICFLYTYNKQDKEDLFQEITLQLWKSYSSFKGISSFSTWMYKVALNTALSFTKKQFFFVEYTENKNEYYDMEHSIIKTDQLKHLYKAIAKLKSVEKAIILLWLEDYSYEDIAQIIGLTKKNISVKLVRIKTTLMKLTTKHESDES